MEGQGTGAASAATANASAPSTASSAPAQSAPSAGGSTGASSAPTQVNQAPARKEAIPLFASESSPEQVAPTGEAAKLIFGKYKDIAEAEKGYRDLYAKLTEKGSIAPETYDIDTAFKDGGISPMDREAAKDAYEAFTAQLKEHGFSQKQLNWMTKFGGQWMREQLQKFGPQIDTDAERSRLAGVWGNNTEGRGKEVTRWANENLPSDVVTKPLLATAEGLRFLHGLMAQQRGPTPMQNSAAPKADATEINRQVDQLMQTAEYRQRTHPMYAATHEKVDRMLAQLKSAMGT